MEGYHYDFFYGELAKRACPPHKPRKRDKDLLNAFLRDASIYTDTWKDITINQSRWRKLAHEVSAAFE